MVNFRASKSPIKCRDLIFESPGCREEQSGDIMRSKESQGDEEQKQEERKDDGKDQSQNVT